MLPDRVSTPGPLTYESGVLPIALRGPAQFCYLLRWGSNLLFAFFGKHILLFTSLGKQFFYFYLLLWGRILLNIYFGKNSACYSLILPPFSIGGPNAKRKSTRVLWQVHQFIQF